MHPLTVTEVNAYLKQVLESNEILADLWVVGEVSEFKRHSSGHCYFSLKHENALMRAVMWRHQAQRLDTLPLNGELVLAHGRISVYESRGDVQFYADSLQPAGLGLAQAKLEALKQQLAAEGLFERKRALPELPRRIGIATAPTGAALQDMLNILRRRCPLLEVQIAPCVVQGERAPLSIIDALNRLYSSDVDLVILARGGGSAEDLAAFNDEGVARALFASPYPTITGVGHETDTTLVDYVADLRAPTPSAAAEIATPELNMLAALLAEVRFRLDDAMGEALSIRREDLGDLNDHLHRAAPARRLDRDRQLLDDLTRRMGERLATVVALRQAHLRGLSDRLAVLSPKATLARGYTMVARESDGQVVTSAAALQPSDRVRLIFADGEHHADVVERKHDD